MENLLFPELNQTFMQTETATVATKDVKRGDLYKVPFSKLQIVEGLNIRKDYGNVEELAESIKENGVKNPLRGYKKGEMFYVVDGHRRYSAMALLFNAGIEVTAPFILQEKSANDEQQVIDMIITNEGKSLTPLEIAEAIRRLLAYGWNEKKIAERLARSESSVIKLNKLNSAPKKLINLIESGVISATQAIEICFKGEAYMFIQDYEAGKFNVPVEAPAPVKSSENNEEGEGKLFTHEKEPVEKKAPERITKKSFNKVNSWKDFSKFVKSSADEIKPERKEAFDFFRKVMENKVTIEEIQEFFSIFTDNDN
jgi:ParB/RepB/Spo0J family partition protein